MQEEENEEGFLFLMMLSDGDIFHGSGKWDSKREREEENCLCWQKIDNFSFFFIINDMWEEEKVSSLKKIISQG